ncbi:MAG: hypothetical protein CO106_11490 [Deltaproteobacteria bacterium CG_4_9_14_3_um_filter_44_9]|nr:MAG: hypothetical protein AUK23_06180 [Deltaproteobacteria bacterium CG2_30_43_15]PIU84641.1 MAG: hypothetical protein COS67_12065 [Deltaproteobacteria bacterium CG06_land_8_20_14_3_00_44_19]PIX23991.1 MAG: hypothetical protein COZ68_07755 [Deltaproteobacteria bacterium CG_4_8_14_3_um_filter_43_13]PIZ18364.1 MAG: hypothetical protein COY50_15835 [Deltaproteobacteria bacterium CG_4_10_14_0_8_um_filter_43_12]PJB39228.1 MAG: hypothetical protein CO106_11490 [Deltaproteobacteria bacterium CG_4_9
MHNNRTPTKCQLELANYGTYVVKCRNNWLTNVLKNTIKINTEAKEDTIKNLLLYFMNIKEC